MAESLDFTLIPADDEGLSPAQELEASIAGAVAEPAAIEPQAAQEPAPFGRSWAFDFEERRFVRSTGSPLGVSGLEALHQWVLMVVHSARFAHRVFSEQFGMEHPERDIGQLRAAEMVSDYGQRLREAVLVHDRITALQNFRAHFDPVEGALRIDYFEIVTDEDEVVQVGDVTLGRADSLVAA